MSRPCISIIVPVYNVEKYLKYCLESIINQSIKDIEIICIDDGSTDNSGKICDEYALKDKRITVVHQNNKGSGITRNNGIKIANSEYVGFVDSDDIIAKDMFEILYKNAKKYNADASYCRFKRFNKKEDIKDNKCEEIIEIFDNEEDIRKYYLNRIGTAPHEKEDVYCSASVCCGIFKKKNIIENNIEFISERNIISEDMIFDLMCIPHLSCIVHSNLEKYFYRGNDKSLTKKYVKDRFYKNLELLYMMEKIISKSYTFDEYQLSLDRYCLTFLRNSIIQEVRYIKSNGKKHAYNQIKSFLSCEEIKKVLIRYPIKKMISKHKLFFYLLKFKCINLSIILVKLKLYMK